MRKIINKFYDMSMFFKITTCFLIIVITSISVTGYIIISTFSDMIMEKEIYLNKEVVKKVKEFAEEKYNRVYSLSNHMHSSRNIAELFAEIDNRNEVGFEISSINFVNNFLMGVCSADKDIGDIILVTKDNIVYTQTNSSNSRVIPSYDFMGSNMIQSLLQSDQKMMLVFNKKLDYMSKGNGNGNVISFVGKIFDPTQYPIRKIVGVYIINIPVQAFENSYKDLANSSKGDIMIVNPSNKVIFSSQKEWVGKNYDYTTDRANAQEDVTVENVGVSGIKVISRIPDDLLHFEINKAIEKMIYVLIISIGITIFSTILIFKLFNSRIQALIKYMHRVQKGDLSFRIPIKSHDEIGNLSMSFNEMCEKLDDYIKRVYYIEIKLRNSELNALQAQINPHFLYNTLESIKMKALEENAEATAEMVVMMGNLFRWSMKTTDKIVMIEDEIDYVNNYLQLQKFRFNDKIEIELKIEDEILDLGIPKLILQPIVENAIKHGILGKKDSGVICITGELKDDHVKITVYDNGVGMNKEILKQIYNDMKKEVDSKTMASIGVINVHQRIRLIFGEGYGLNIESTENVGTSVKLIIPAMNQESMRELCSGIT